MDELPNIAEKIRSFFLVFVRKSESSEYRNLKALDFTAIISMLI